MSRMKRFVLEVIYLICILGFTAYPNNAHSELVPVQDTTFSPIFNCPGVILDTATNLDWLNLNYTAGWFQNYNMIPWWLSEGNRFYGWQIATSAEVFQLWNDANLPGGVFSDYNGRYNVQVTYFQNLIGAWNTTPESGGGGNMYSFESSGYVYGGGVLQLIQYAHQQNLNIIVDGNYAAYYDAASISGFQGGVWLIRDAVPIPGTVWLFGFGLAGLIGLKKKYLT